MFFLLLTTPLWASPLASSASWDRLLVILQDESIKTSHSQFFTRLASKSYKMDYMIAGDPDQSIDYWGEWKYDSIIIFAPTADDFGELLDIPKLTAFIDHGGNILLAGSSTPGDAVTELAAECGAHFSGPVIDHFHHVGQEAQQVVSSMVVDAPALVSRPRSPLVFGQGSGHLLSRGGLHIPVLTGHPTAFSHDPKSQMRETPAAVGHDLVLVSALQARQSHSRVVVSGSLELFSDAHVGTNAKFVEELTSWVLQERGLVRAHSVRHVGEDKVTSDVYVVGQEIDFGVSLEEWKDGEWQPLVNAQVQVQVIMLDPHVIVDLKDVGGTGRYEGKITLPDVFGIFTLRVEFAQIGYNRAIAEQRVSVRPPRHDEYERFIESAFPYYTGVFAMMIAFFAFNVMYAFSK